MNIDEYAFGMFTYGTLMDGKRLPIQPSASVPATIKGSLFDISWFPGFNFDGDDDVVGILHLWAKKRNEQTTLEDVDRYENEGVLYIRHTIWMGDTPVYLYEYNGPPKMSTKFLTWWDKSKPEPTPLVNLNEGDI